MATYDDRLTALEAAAEGLLEPEKEIQVVVDPDWYGNAEEGDKTPHVCPANPPAPGCPWCAYAAEATTKSADPPD